MTPKRQKEKPPCHECKAACCRNVNGSHKFAVLICEDESHLFPEAKWFDAGWGDGSKALALPYVRNKCIHLGKDNKCKIYDRRPQLCREFTCLSGYGVKKGHHSFFLEDHPEVVELIELHILKREK